MRRITKCLLPLVAVAALAVPVAASAATAPKATTAHKMKRTPLRNTVNQTAAERVADPNTPWLAHAIERCDLGRGSRRHRHLGGCLVHFGRSDGSMCSYGIFLRFRSSRSFRVRVRYVDLQPEDLSCPSRP
jgi:hypothetical protein